ncbi:MAG: hypothetical protein JJU10_00640 [Idiomarina sp.]|nr:hypothetical protein [Idiomarina sp.]
MTSGLQNQKMLDTGAERLRLLGKYAEPLMDAYLHGELDEAALGERVIQRLLQARIVWRPDHEQGLKLRPQMARMVASMIADESRRQANAEVGEELDRIENAVLSYQEAIVKGQHSYAELQLQSVTEYVHDLLGQFDEAIDSLWHRLNSHFGFVSSLSEKIRENERAQKQIRRLLEGLEQISLGDMIELARDHTPLRKLLVVHLQDRLSTHHASLYAVQERMIELLARFREQQSRAVLVQNMAAYLRQNPQFVPGDYTWRSKVPDLVNQSSPIVPAAHAALDRSADTEVLAEIVASLPTRELKPQSATGEAAAVKLADDRAVQAKEQALKDDVERYYVATLDEDKGLSALAFLKQQKLNWDPEIWLFQVLAEYQGLNASEREQLTLDYCQSEASIFNQLQLIHDVTVRIRDVA